LRKYLALPIYLAAAMLVVSSAVGQSRDTAADEVSKGHHLALMVCSICHVAAADQENTPMLHPPGPSFESIAQRKDVDAVSLENFLNTTHRNLASQKGMPNPQLMEFQVKEVVAYLLSLRK
jgi:mono/diheme cytochrome c family protein